MSQEYPFYTNKIILNKAEKLSELLNVSKVARNNGGWFYNWKRSNNNNKDVFLISGTRKVPAWNHRNSFIKRHLGIKYPYMDSRGVATRHFLSFLMWNYTPLNNADTEKIINTSYAHYFN